MQDFDGALDINTPADGPDGLTESAALTDWLPGWTSDPRIAPLVVVLALVLLYLARRPVRDAVDASFGGVAALAIQAAARIRFESRRVAQRLEETLKEINAQDLELRLWRIERDLDRRVQTHFDRIEPIADALRAEADVIERNTEVVRERGVTPANLQAINETICDAMGERARGADVNTVARRVRDTVKGHARELAVAARTMRRGAERVQTEHDRLIGVDLRLERHAREINTALELYEGLLRSPERRGAAFGASALVPWFAAVIVLAVALAGTFLNYQLIARPMAELVGEGARVGGIRVSEAASITLILLEAATGLVLMEALTVTRMLPNFDRMGPRLAHVIAGAAVFFLLIFSVVEVFLAFQRETLIGLEEDLLAAASGLSPAAEPAEGGGGISFAAIAQGLLGGAIPWILAIAAIPLETVLRHSPLVIQVAWRATLALAAFALGLAGWAIRQLGQVLMQLYDVVIFIPLVIEAAFTRRAREETS